MTYLGKQEAPAWNKNFCTVAPLRDTASVDICLCAHFAGWFVYFQGDWLGFQLFFVLPWNLGDGYGWHVPFHELDSGIPSFENYEVLKNAFDENNTLEFFLDSGVLCVYRLR